MKDEFLQNGARVVGGHAIGNQDFHAVGGVVLRKDGIQAALDVGRFVANGKYKRDKRKKGYCH